MKTRADVRLARDGLAESREKARRLILDGKVSSGGRLVVKPSEMIEDTGGITVRSDGEDWVGRGGLKLEKAIKVFGIPVEGRIFADIGASTGGFTECLLRHGVRLVYAVDVGHGQLHHSLRADHRVRVMEGVNARELGPDDFDVQPQDAVMDVSFISILKILPALHRILPGGGAVTALIKPQFEAGRQRVGKHGLVKDPGVHREILSNVVGQAGAMGFLPLGLDCSPVRGQTGNIEFLLYARKDSEGEFDRRTWDAVIGHVVDSAHQSVK